MRFKNQIEAITFIFEVWKQVRKTDPTGAQILDRALTGEGASTEGEKASFIIDAITTFLKHHSNEITAEQIETLKAAQLAVAKDNGMALRSD
jgi:hypothetical protein